MAETPINYFSTNPVIGSAATSGALLDFGFPASLIRVYNAGTVDLYINLRGLNACGMTTGTEHIIRTVTSEVFPLSQPIGSLAVWTTSTSAGGQRVSVLALG